ncbi:MAG: flippase-like domain-containing protein [Planctomycetales bacterium]|nr:flippase-like domain-containing protein [Planctomycetales bacterium]
MSAKHPPRYRHLITAVKLLAGGSIIAWLAWHAAQHEMFQQLAQGQKRWGLLVLAVLLCGINVCMTFVRWYYVSRAAGVPLKFGEAVRLGTLGYILNFVSPGSVGGDLFKGAVLAKDRPGRRTAALTTVFVDRSVAMVSFLLYACVGFAAILASGAELPAEALAAGWGAVAILAGVVGCAALFLSPVVNHPAVADRVRRVPVLGEPLSWLLSTWNVYRKGLRWLGVAFLVCVGGHIALVSSFYCVGKGLPLTSPSLLSHVFMVPFACLSGAIPLFPGGLGAMEGALDFLYYWMGAPRNTGAFVAFGYRLAMIAIAIVATPYYLTHQAVVRRGLEEAEHLQED